MLVIVHDPYLEPEDVAAHGARPTSILVNTARPVNALFSPDNVIITPHAAYYCDEAHMADDISVLSAATPHTLLG